MQSVKKKRTDINSKDCKQKILPTFQVYIPCLLVRILLPNNTTCTNDVQSTIYSVLRKPKKAFPADPTFPTLKSPPPKPRTTTTGSRPRPTLSCPVLPFRHRVLHVTKKLRYPINTNETSPPPHCTVRHNRPEREKREKYE